MEKPSASQMLINFHNALDTSSSTLTDPNYITQYIIDDKVCYNEYPNGTNDGHIFRNEGLFKFELDGNDVVLLGAENAMQNGSITEYFYTTRDLKDFKSNWNNTTGYTYTSSNASLGEIILELDGKGIFSYVTESYNCSLTIADDGLSATYYVEAKLEAGYGGTETAEFTVSDLGTTTNALFSNYLKNQPALTKKTSWTEDEKAALEYFSGIKDFPVPNLSSLVNSEVWTSSGIPAKLVVEDYGSGDICEGYRESLFNAGFTQSALTTPNDDMKTYGYVIWIFEKYLTIEEGHDLFCFVKFYHVPKIQIEGEYEQKMFPNGRFEMSVSIGYYA